MNENENDNINDINVLMEELKDTKKLGNSFITHKAAIPTDYEKLTEETVGKFVLEKSSQIIQQSINTLENIKDGISSTGDPESIEAYSKLVTAVAGSIEVLNKIHLQNKKNQNNIDLRKMDIELTQKSIEAGSVTNNVFIASREEIMQKLFGESEKFTTITVESEELPQKKLI